MVTTGGVKAVSHHECEGRLIFEEFFALIGGMNSLERENPPAEVRLPWEFNYPKMAGEMAEKRGIFVNEVVDLVNEFFWRHTDFFSEPGGALTVFWLLYSLGRDPTEL